MLINSSYNWIYCMFHGPIHAESSKVYTINLYHFSTVITVLKLIYCVKSNPILKQYLCTVVTKSSCFTYGSGVVIGTILGWTVWRDKLRIIFRYSSTNTTQLVYFISFFLTTPFPPTYKPKGEKNRSTFYAFVTFNFRKQFLLFPLVIFIAFSVENLNSH